MRPKARSLILDLMLAADGVALSARDAISACSLFGISANNARVALVRLAADGLIASSERGLYQLGDSAHELADEVAGWRTAEQRVRPWSGGYLCVHSAPLGRSDRSALRRRQRALNMLGFRELEPGLHLRPDNIEDSVDAVRRRLHALGLPPQASVFLASAFDDDNTARIKKLWDTKTLNLRYRTLQAQLESWLQRADTLEPDVAAREAFLLGGKAIREVVFDPLLPEPMADVKARHAFVACVRRFDKAGQKIWLQLWRERVPAEPPAAARRAMH